MRQVSEPKVIWIEKEALPWLPRFWDKLLLPASVHVVSDYDDAVFYRYDQHRYAPVRLLLRRKIDRIMKCSQLVTAANAYISNRARHAGVAQVEIVPTVVDSLISVYSQELNSQRLIVIQTCTDLDSFQPVAVRNAGARVYSCIATVLSGWFHTDWLTAAAYYDPNARFEIVTRDDPQKVRAALDYSGSLNERLTIAPGSARTCPMSYVGTIFR